MANILNKKQIKSYNVKPVKKLGQNYLINSLIVEQIVSKSGVNSSINVIEIGPGTGNLTKEIAKNCKELICLEIDKKIIELLTNELKEYNNVHVINDDILTVNLEDIVSKFSTNSETWIIANIPYYISSPIIFKFLTELSSVQRMVIMVQKEFAERMVASVGQKEYNGFSIICNLFSSTKKILNVSRNNFYPVPNVESVVVSVTKKDIYTQINRKEFFLFVRNIFSFKRKTLHNNLLTHYTKDNIQQLKKSTNLNLTRRAETLTIEESVLIYKSLYGKN